MANIISLLLQYYCHNLSQIFYKNLLIISHEPNYVFQLTVEEGFEVFNDINGTITSNMISVFDSKNDTCVKLPVIGQTPPILWMRINTSMIWGLAPSAFQLTVIGQGISCNKHNNVTLLQVKMLHAL